MSIQREIFLVSLCCCWFMSCLHSLNALVCNVSSNSKCILLKKTVDADLETISSLLASTTQKSHELNGLFDWVAQINYLKAKDSFFKQIQCRLQVIQEGERVIRGATAQTNDSGNNDFDMRRILFDHDSFRWKLERATSVSIERHGWENHNFALVPENPRLLQHLMVSAHDEMQGSVVGYCELAMLLTPSGSSHKDEYLPCIVNLVVSPQYRRIGIGTKMVRCVARYAKQYWMHNNDNASLLALFVDKDNEQALKLYQKQQFVLAEDLGDRFYLTRFLTKPV